ncbi:hypothetical protein VDGE_04217 [Verticillium dahliae]|nr:hypothetical protein VDGE_04217 [Verticillium dahliae]
MRPFAQTQCSGEGAANDSTTARAVDHQPVSQLDSTHDSQQPTYLDTCHLESVNYPLRHTFSSPSRARLPGIMAGSKPSSPFGTFLIVGSVCFFLGILFASFPYDYPLLWTSAPVPEAYYAQLETHLRFIYAAPPLIGRLLTSIILVGFIGFFVKLFKASEANVLFDGASLVLYFIGVGVYLTNIVRGLRAVGEGIWDDPDWEVKANGNAGQGDGLVLGKEDSLKVLSASNTILALVLVGVLVLQVGQAYAERKELEEIEALDKKDKEAAAAAGKGGAANKKKQ